MQGQSWLGLWGLVQSLEFRDLSVVEAYPALHWGEVPCLSLCPPEEQDLTCITGVCVVLIARAGCCQTICNLALLLCSLRACLRLLRVLERVIRTSLGLGGVHKTKV